VYTLVQLGYEFDEDRQAKIRKQIEGTESGWCFGATLAMTGADLAYQV
jgi:guanosine-diphosphatase